jgi:hypothetical protein
MDSVDLTDEQVERLFAQVGGGSTAASVGGTQALQKTSNYPLPRLRPTR